jgi:mannosylglycoprotein endo-beta-mannosidase
VTGFSDFVQKAQMVNYEQYRSLQEGQNARMWDWYTGMLVWKNQNPWTSLRGQFYDVYLEQNGSFYGYMHGAKPFHAQISLDDTTLCLINSTPKERRDNLLSYKVYDLTGKLIMSSDTLVTAGAGEVVRLGKIPVKNVKSDIAFVKLVLQNRTATVVYDENTYWFGTNKSDYSSMSSLGKVGLSVIVSRTTDTRVDIEVHNNGSEPAVFVRFRITDTDTGMNLVPVFYEDNYITLMPGEKRYLKADLSSVPGLTGTKPLTLYWKGFNVIEASKFF